MTKDSGGTAFPMPGMIPDLGLYAEPGMTLRDWFAGQALQGILAGKPTTYGAMLNERPNSADLAYKFADAMIEARKQPKET